MCKRMGVQYPQWPEEGAGYPGVTDSYESPDGGAGN